MTARKPACGNCGRRIEDKTERRVGSNWICDRCFQAVKESIKR